jgi:hypothetical protein
VHAQVPEPPVVMVIGLATQGDLAAAAVLIQNRTTSHITLADIRCVIDPNWTYVSSWAGQQPGQNLGFPSLTALAGPDGQVLDRTVISWINNSISGGTAVGPFIYVFNTNSKPGYTWCNGTFIGGTFNRNLTSEMYQYVP